MDQVTQGAFVKTKAIGGVEASRAGAAQGAATFEVQRESILERSFALRAKILGRMGYGVVETIEADGNSRVSAQRFMADTAFVGENDRKKSVRNLQ